MELIMAAQNERPLVYRHGRLIDLDILLEEFSE